MDKKMLIPIVILFTVALASQGHAVLYYQNNASNSTSISSINQGIKFSAYWTNSTATTNVSCYIFEWNYTAGAVMTNDSAVNMSDPAVLNLTNAWSNISKTIDNATLEGGTFAWRIYVNDSGDVWNVTPQVIFTVPNANPSISASSNSPGTPNPGTGSNVNLNCTGSDNFGISSVYFESDYTNPGGTRTNYSGSAISSTDWYYTIPSYWIDTNGQKTYYWKCYYFDNASVYGAGSGTNNAVASSLQSFSAVFSPSGTSGGGGGGYVEGKKAEAEPKAGVVPTPIPPTVPAKPSITTQIATGISNFFQGIINWFKSIFK